MKNGKVWIASAIVLLGWGVAALGASQPWGYVPLLSGMSALGAATFLTCPDAGIGRGLGVSLIGVCLAVACQLIPMPLDVVSTISPAAAPLVSRGAAEHPLSIGPDLTALGLAFIAALGLFFVGMVRLLSRDGAQRMATGLVWLGAAVALVGIAEASTSGPSLYRAAGLPLPPDSTPYGPFSSKNHYAGWMMMALAVTSGYLCAFLEQSTQRWSGRAIVMMGAATTMAVALAQTRSRAGILGLALTVAMMGGLLMRRGTSLRLGILLAVPMVLVLLTGIGVAGVQPIVKRFSAPSWSSAHGRLPIWRQAAAIARDFPITGSGFNTYQRVVPFYPSAELDEPYEGAHNDFLQLAAEGGLLVGIPVLTTIGFFIWDTRRRFRESWTDGTTEWLRTGAIVGLVLIAVQETVDFSLQVPGNAALFVVLAAIAVHRAPRPATRGRAIPR